MKLAIRGEGMTAKGYRVELAGVDLTNHLTELNLALSVHDANVAVIRILPDEVDIDAEALVRLRAEVESRDASFDQEKVVCEGCGQALVNSAGAWRHSEYDPKCVTPKPLRLVTWQERL